MQGCLDIKKLRKSGLLVKVYYGSLLLSCRVTAIPCDCESGTAFQTTEEQSGAVSELLANTKSLSAVAGLGAINAQIGIAARSEREIGASQASLVEARAEFTIAQ